MQDVDSAVIAVMTALGAAVMAALMVGFHRQYRKSYLLHWTLGWTAAAVFHFGVPVLSNAAGYLQIGWLAFGLGELVRRRPVRLVTVRRILLLLAAFGAANSFFFPALRGFVAAAVFAAAGVALWRVRARRSGIGFAILAATLVAYGAEQIVPIASVDFLLQTVLGISMIACLLEDEREAADLATVEIEHLAYHDALTGLPNRPLFIDRLIVALAQANRSNHKLAVFFLDLDRFKDINDSLGHSAGDALLKAAAERVRRCVREGDTVARFGGDEFTLLIPRIENIEDAAKIAQKVLETLKIPFTVADRELFVTTSIGISIYPGDGLDPETLVRNADTAMYRAKDQGRDNYQLYAPAMNAHALQRLALENMLRRALDHRELVVFYQPLVALESRRILGVEALVRWNHPELGLLSPAHFISVAELSGLIIPIGQWVLLSACKQVKAWHRHVHHDLTVSVNLSARQFQQPDLVEQVRAALDESGLDPSYLELEITESNAMQNAENTIYTLRELKTIGIRIAMDDFGTGYSSLNYLKRFPIDTLKLDQSFVRDVTTDRIDAAIASAVITMAHSLNLEVVAEGVETEEQLAFLRKQKCDRIQGFLFSAPLSAEELEPYLAERKMVPA